MKKARGFLLRETRTYWFLLLLLFTVHVYSTENLELDTFDQLQSGQTIQIDVETIHLSKALFIEVSNVTVRGATSQTSLICPNDDGILFTNASSVVLERLVFSDCSVPVPALQIVRDDNEEKEQLTVSITDCVFANNLGFGAVETNNARVRMENVTFTDNWGDDSGGALRQMNGNAIIRNSVFKKNTAKGRGGAIYVTGGDLTLAGCVLYHNSAKEEGGAFYAEKSTVNLDSCNFTDNVALPGGGSVAAYDVTLHCSKSTMSKGYTNIGGGIVAGGDSDVEISNSSFSSNLADVGAGIALLSGTRFRAVDNGGQSLFKRNRAEFGGGIACIECESVTIDEYVSFKHGFVYDHGGGVYLLGAEYVEINNASFFGNEAKFGGGISIVNSQVVKLGNGDTNTKSIDFIKNHGTIGGGLYIKPRSIGRHVYEITNCLFSRNEAVQWEPWRSIRNKNRSKPPMSRYAPMESNIFKWCWYNCRGSGGAFRVDLDNLEQLSAVSLIMTNTRIRNNKGRIGGGGYISFDPKFYSQPHLKHCGNFETFLLKGCYYLHFSNTTVVENKAEAGGGFYFGFPPEDIVENCLSQQNAIGCPIVHNNTLKRAVGNYGQDIATSAHSLQLLDYPDYSRLGTFSDGELLVDRRRRSKNQQTRYPGEQNKLIRIVIKDFLNQTIRSPVADASLTVGLRSNSIRGQQEYEAQNGIITITDTYARRGSFSGASAIVAFESRSGIPLKLRFYVSGCANGKMWSRRDSRCFRCSSDEYTLEDDESTCRKCEKNAMCLGTRLLVPVEGYWHSTPASPFMLRCLVEKACSFDGRTAMLLWFYSSPHPTRTSPSRNRGGSHQNWYSGLQDYQQCSDGYDGVVCGSCTTGYGRVSVGSCVQCSQHRWLIAFQAIAILLLALAFYLLKLWTTITATRESVAKEEDPQEEIDRDDDADFSRTQTTHDDLGSNRLSTMSAPSSTIVAATSSVDPAQESTPATEQLPAEQSHPRTVTAQALSTTFSIFFNYIQLTSLAVMLDGRWISGEKVIWKMHYLLGRSTGVSNILPAECVINVHDSDSEQINQIALFLRTTIPVLFLLLCFGVWLILRLSRPNPQRPATVSSNEQNKNTFVTPKRMTFGVLLLASILDICCVSFVILNCMHIQTNSRHPFAKHNSLSNDIWLLKEDTDIECWTGAHMATTIIVSIFLGMTIAGAVFVFLTLLDGKAKGKLGREDFLRKYGYLYASYRQEGLALYWEILIVLRKVVTALVLVRTQYRSRAGLQSKAVCGVLVLFAFLQLMIKPFDDRSCVHCPSSTVGQNVRFVVGQNLADRWMKFHQSLSFNTLETASILMTLAVFGSAVLGSGSRHTIADIASVLCQIASWVFFCILVYRVWYCWRRYKETQPRVSDPLSSTTVDELCVQLIDGNRREETSDDVDRGVGDLGQASEDRKAGAVDNQDVPVPQR